MNKQLLCTLKLILPATKASPNSVLGAALGPFGINLISFCKEFNNLTIAYKGLPISIKLWIYSDKKYNLIIKTPPTINLIYEFCNLKSKSWHNQLILTDDIINKIIKLKYNDFKLLTIDKIKTIIYDTAHSLGVLYKS
uniref:50S ribosomal protein L11 n=1 Tax=Nephromyces sp. ex Molgula occidentalis TaxID=2544991 RepID=A0A5C1H7X5_9APIC|nr:50S ribosomal protein L11 [Nephromyces sp. ex Molgula occidentalis]